MGAGRVGKAFAGDLSLTCLFNQQRVSFLHESSVAFNGGDDKKKTQFREGVFLMLLSHEASPSSCINPVPIRQPQAVRPSVRRV